MKIDSNLPGIRSLRTRGDRPEKGKAAAGGAPSASLSGDTVQLTSTASRLRALEAALAEVDIQDAGKVEEIRQAIAEGRFQVDEEAVADGLIQTTLEQFRAGGR
jgi:negative regulator of flagellin synthesis FlgM